MIEDCKQHKLDLIVTKSVSRFARNIYHCIGYVRELAALKPPVGVLFETEGLYTLKDESEMALSFTATFAQEESRTRSSAMNLSYEMRFRRGIFMLPELLGYGLMLDRMSLSAKNGWMDDNQRVYIYFTLEDVCQQLCCKMDKAVKLFAELDEAKGIGLIERIRQGQGRPAKIYPAAVFCDRSGNNRQC